MTWPWKVGLAAAALVLAFAGGYAAHRCPQAVEEHATTAASSSISSTAATTTTTGPRDIEIDVGGWAPPVIPGALPDHRVRPPAAGPFAGLPPGSVVRIHEGPTVQEEHRTTQATSTTATILDMKISPATRHEPSRAFQIGFEDVVGRRDLRLAFRDGFRLPLIGLPIEGELSFTPRRGFPGGFGAAVAFRF